MRKVGHDGPITGFADAPSSNSSDAAALLWAVKRSAAAVGEVIASRGLSGQPAIDARAHHRQHAGGAALHAAARAGAVEAMQVVGEAC